ncbi:unnamed protein product [Closterium sp. NIES-65]|nr:unnamed protein product [Closterium sp. NIES-65]
MPGEPFFLIAGPNVIESEQHTLHMARAIKEVADSLGLRFVFKASFDKANRTSVDAFRGPGMEQGLKILEQVRQQVHVPVLTDVHETNQCEPVARVVDVIQIPAFLCRQTDLLTAAALTGRPIHIKKGQMCSVKVVVAAAEKVRAAGNSHECLDTHSWMHLTNIHSFHPLQYKASIQPSPTPHTHQVVVAAAEKVRAAGNPHVMVCERGTMFGYGDLILDPRNLVQMRAANCPVVADVTHSLQQPAQRQLPGGGLASAGQRHLIPAVARACVAVGVDGVFMEVHDNPEAAPVDGPTQWVSEGG